MDRVDRLGPVLATVLLAVSTGACGGDSTGPRGLTGEFAVTGRGTLMARWTSDLWVHGDHAYTGTVRVRNTEDGTAAGDALYVWDVADPDAPRLVDSVLVDAFTVNDVKVRADGAIAVITHEGSVDLANGITLLDLSDPAHPSVITRYTEGLESGVHNVWIDGDHAYVALDGESRGDGGLRIVEISDPAGPTTVGRFYAGSSLLHDVHVRDGLAFLSHWNAGLVILDVGHGAGGGSPESPVELGRIATRGGQTHNAWYWPETGYVFVGEEDFVTPGMVHVVDASDLTAPREVATYRVPGTTPHNFWLDEERRILYVAWYTNGLVAIDVAGRLQGRLDEQSREIARTEYDGAGACFGAGTCAWGPQLHRDRLFVSDLNSGLWVLRPSF